MTKQHGASLSPSHGLPPAKGREPRRPCHGHRQLPRSALPARDLFSERVTERDPSHKHFKLLISDHAVKIGRTDRGKSIVIFVRCSAEALQQLLLEHPTRMVWKPTQLGKDGRADDDDHYCLGWDILIGFGAHWRSTCTKHGLRYEAVKWNADNAFQTQNNGIPFSLLMY